VFVLAHEIGPAGTVPEFCALRLRSLLMARKPTAIRKPALFRIATVHSIGRAEPIVLSMSAFQPETQNRPNRHRLGTNPVRLPVLQARL